jgi:hypothetical protein
VRARSSLAREAIVAERAVGSVPKRGCCGDGTRGWEPRCAFVSLGEEEVAMTAVDAGRTTRVRRSLVFVGLGLALVGVIVVPHAVGAGPSPSPIPQGCQLRSPQPDAPLRLNVVAVSNTAKTIAVDKEIFTCFDAQSQLASVKDVETVIETVETGDVKKAPSITTTAESVVTETCTKDLQSGRLSCSSRTLPLGVSATPLARCTVTHGTYPFDTIQQPADPLDMGTAVLADGLVKTVDVETETFACSGQIGDLYVLHEDVEFNSRNGFTPVSDRFQGVMCFKDEATATVTSCKLVNPGAASK